jgi:RimJ/RimL family protein N-acetyltransferase
VLRAFLDRIVFTGPALACVSDPQTENQRSVRAFTNAGFRRVRTVQLPGEPYTREVMCCARVG